MLVLRLLAKQSQGFMKKFTFVLFKQKRKVFRHQKCQEVSECQFAQIGLVPRALCKARQKWFDSSGKVSWVLAMCSLFSFFLNVHKIMHKHGIKQ